MKVKQDFFNEVEQRLRIFVEKVIKDIQKELEDQGHVLTGRLRDSIEQEIKRKPNMIESLIYLEDYGLSIDQGIKAGNVPYSPPSGRGGKSKYIQGLITFFRLRGLDAAEAKQAAFATANKAIQEGHPTKGSFFYSTNQRRKGFFSGTLNRLEGEINNFFDELGENVILGVWNNILKRYTEKLEPIIIRV